MNPCELNALITAIANHLYATLSKEDFLCLSVILSELTKSMCSLEVMRGICFVEKVEESIGGIEKKH